MSRRNGRRLDRRNHNTRPGGATTFAGVFRTGDVWFDADHVTAATLNVGAFVDVMDATHTCVQAAPGNQVLLPTASAALNSQLAVSVTGAQWYVSSRAASTWGFRHDATGSEEFHVFVTPAPGINATLAATFNNGGGLLTQVGASHGMYNSAGTEVNSSAIGNATATPPVNAGVSNGAQAGGAGTYLDISTSGTGYVIRKQGTIKGSGAYASTPSASAPFASLNLFSAVAGANNGTLVWAASYFFRRTLTTNDRALIQAGIQTKYGVAP